MILFTKKKGEKKLYKKAFQFFWWSFKKVKGSFVILREDQSKQIPRSVIPCCQKREEPYVQYLQRERAKSRHAARKNFFSAMILTKKKIMKNKFRG